MYIISTILLIAVSLTTAGRPQNNLNIISGGGTVGIGGSRPLVIEAESFSGNRPGNAGGIVSGFDFGTAGSNRPGLAIGGSRVVSGPGGSRVVSGPGGSRVVSGPEGSRIVLGPGGSRIVSGSGVRFGGGSSGNGGGFSLGTGSGDQVIIGQGPIRTGFPNVQHFDPFGSQLTLTVSDTTTIDSFVTVTDVILNSVPVTLTGFNIHTVIVTTYGAHQTEVDDFVAIRTTIVERPVTDFVTIAKSNFVYVTDFSVEFYTITHSAYLIHQTTHTTVATQTLTMSSPVIRTHLTTSVATQTEFQTIVNTVFVNGYH